jgi:hypothetical protein
MSKPSFPGRISLIESIACQKPTLASKQTGIDNDLELK